MNKFYLKIAYLFYHPNSQIILRLLITISLFIFNSHAWADSGTDLLQGTDKNAWATFEGTGKKYLYLGEGLLAIFTFIKTKNALALVGIVVVAVFINIILKMAGES